MWSHCLNMCEHVWICVNMVCMCSCSCIPTIVKIFEGQKVWTQLQGSSLGHWTIASLSVFCPFKVYGYISIFFTIFTMGNYSLPLVYFPVGWISLKMGSAHEGKNLWGEALEGKNLLHEEQILSFKSWPLFRREAKTRTIVLLPLIMYHLP